MKKTALSFSCAFVLTVGAWGADATPAVDNTEKNTRDRSEKAKTSGDQGQDKDDIKISAAIRRAVVKDDSLSTMAKNVKIITIHGDVTLRGPVKDDAEKQKIAAHAKEGGAKSVINQLEVKKAEKAE